MAGFDYIIFCDGSGSTNGNNVEIGGGKAVAFITKDGKTPIEVKVRKFKHPTTCNEAEYSACILALEEDIESNSKILLCTDSLLVVNQMNPTKPWKINYEHLQLLNNLLKDVIHNFELDVEFRWISRDVNLAGLWIEGKYNVDDELVIIYE